MFKTNTEQMDVVNANTNAFMALSKIAFSSAERLTTVNLDAARAALEESSTASNAWAHTKDLNDLQGLWNLSSGQATQRVTAYLHNVQEIAAQAQEETTKLMTAYFSAITAGATAGTGWTAGFDMFKNFAQQMSGLAEANIKAASDTTSRMATQATPPARKAA
jgi:phasin family protein